MIVQSKSKASIAPTQPISISNKSERVKQSKTNEFYYQEGEGVREFSSDAHTPYGNFGAKVCRGFAIKRGHL